MNKESTKQRKYLVLLELVLLGVSMWLISGIVVKRIPYSMVITDIYQPPVGGSCGYILYDENGNGYQTIKSDHYDNTGSILLHRSYVTSGYIGSAPLYDVKPEAIGLKKDSSGCYDFPSVVDTVIAQNGTPMYPVFFEAKNNSKSEWLTVGESYSLAVVSKIGDSFPPNLVWIPVIPFTPNEIVEVKFSLYATNFEFSPTNQETRKTPMGLDLPAEQTWSIAPIDRANGSQFLKASIEGDNLYASTFINLNIRNVLGIDPKLLSVIIPIGSVIAFLLTQTKTFTDLLQVYKKKTNRKKITKK